MGSLVGNLIAGKVFDAVSSHHLAQTAFREYWAFPAVLAALLAIVMFTFFREAKAPSAVPGANGSPYRP